MNYWKECLIPRSGNRPPIFTDSDKRRRRSGALSNSSSRYRHDILAWRNDDHGRIVERLTSVGSRRNGDSVVRHMAQQAGCIGIGRALVTVERPRQCDEKREEQARVRYESLAPSICGDGIAHLPSVY
jgi:hypothetical protein